MTLVTKMWKDEAGFIVSAELILVATIVVLAMVVGLAEVSFGINEELEDVASAFGTVNQSYCFNGLCGHQGLIGGSCYYDRPDFCDRDRDLGPNWYSQGENHNRNW